MTRSYLRTTQQYPSGQCLTFFVDHEPLHCGLIFPAATARGDAPVPVSVEDVSFVGSNALFAAELTLSSGRLSQFLTGAGGPSTKHTGG